VAPPLPPLGAPEPVPFPIVGTLPNVPPPIDAIGLTIVDARLHFDSGEEAYQTGFLKKAKDEFDEAIDILLEASAEEPDDPRLRAEIKDMVARVHVMELAAIRQGDGFTDQTGDHAAIDDLQQVQTFPSLIDPKLKSAVEEDVKKITYGLPIDVNDRVLGFLEYYEGTRGRNSITPGFERMGLYRPMIERVLTEEGLPLDLIYLCQAESAFLPRALSRAKAKGMWQFISSRGKEYGLRQTWWVDERSDPEKSTRAAARHLKDLYEEFGDWYLAMAAYNAGPFRVSRALEKSGATTFWELADKRLLPKETINYVPNIVALTIIGNNPEKYGFDFKPAQPLETERVAVDKATDLRVIAEAIDLSLDELRDLNAHVLRWTTPPDDPEFELILPKGYGEKFSEKIASLPQSQRVLWRNHTVKRGETLSVVAKKYGASISELASANNVDPKKPLKAGQSLIIPIGGSAPKPVQTATKTQTASTTAKRTETYTVRKGDTLNKIATRFKVSVANLKSWNKLSSNRVAVGRKLIVAKPVPTQTATQTASLPEQHRVVHQVRQGETLDKIATLYKTTVDAILTWNKRNDLSVLHPGDQITVFVGN
jgi:membrane-bound lytic murein transglycosylase D